MQNSDKPLTTDETLSIFHACDLASESSQKVLFIQEQNEAGEWTTTHCIVSYPKLAQIIESGFNSQEIFFDEVLAQVTKSLETGDWDLPKRWVRGLPIKEEANAE